MPKKTKPAAPSAVARMDSWTSTITGLGVRGRDRTQSVYFARDNALTQQGLDALYRHDGLARRIVDLIANEMTREWFKIEGDPDDDVNGKLEAIGAKLAVRDLIRWGRLYGGAIAVMLIDDGGDLAEPVNEGSIQDVLGVHVYDRWQVRWETADLYVNPAEPKFGQPMLYRVSPGGAMRAPDGRFASDFAVHETRVLRFDGVPLPRSQLLGNAGWGDSVLQAPYTQLRNIGAVYAGAANIVEDFIQATISVKGLSELVATNQSAAVYERMNILDMTRHVLNAIFLDADGETYQKHASSVGGLPDLLDRFANALSATTGIPVTLLMGQAPAGLQATGDADIRNWYDKIAAEQNDRLSPLVERLVRLIFLSRAAGIAEPENWKIEWCPLWQLTEQEEANVRKTRAETDAIYISASVLDPDEVAVSRFGGDRYGKEIEKIDRTPPTPAELAAARAAEEAARAAAAAQAPPAPNGSNGAAPAGGMVQ